MMNKWQRALGAAGVKSIDKSLEHLACACSKASQQWRAVT
jgi:hypothetical protein